MKGSVLHASAKISSTKYLHTLLMYRKTPGAGKVEQFIKNCLPPNSSLSCPYHRGQNRAV